jgi:CBS domain-containing protein
MAEKNVGAILVISEGKPLGIITDRDIVVRCVAENLDCDDTTVENVLTESIHVAKDTDGLFEVIRKMRTARVRRIPVVDGNGSAIGIISFGDIVGLLSRELVEVSIGATPEKNFEEKAA